MNRPVEVTTQYATTVETLGDAWAFVMAHIDQVGSDPSIEISPVWVLSMSERDSGDSPRHFSVMVSGMVERGGNA